MTAHRRSDGTGYDYICKKGNMRACPCKKVSIACRSADGAAWLHAVEIIKDPKQVEQKLEKRKQEHPPDKDLSYVDAELERIAAEIENLVFLGKTAPDKQVLGTLGGLINDLVRQRQKYEAMRKPLLDIEEKRKKEAAAIVQFEEQCATWRQKLKSPNPTFSYEEMRKAIEFFGIKAVVWGSDHKPRLDITLDPPDFVSIGL